MQTEPDVTRMVRSWLRTDEQVSADGVLNNVLAVLDATPQRQRVRPSRRFADSDSIAKWAIAAAAVVVVAVVSTNLLPPSGEGGGAPTSASPSPSATVGRVGNSGLPPVGATPAPRSEESSSCGSKEPSVAP